MSTIAVYLDDRLEQRLRQAAQQDGVSVSRWVARLVEERTAVAWPAEVVALAGAWADEDLQRPAAGDDVPRIAL
ncbi:MAG: CopG family transcriptional regulator [Planctomycetes bacterium]|nr:CopG family transcriptional regulator [Planctomycetota bacterium]